jgi:hypothetical protein
MKPRLGFDAGREISSGNMEPGAKIEGRWTEISSGNQNQQCEQEIKPGGGQDLRDINMCLLASWSTDTMTLIQSCGGRSLILNIIQATLMCFVVEIGTTLRFGKEWCGLLRQPK